MTGARREAWPSTMVLMRRPRWVAASKSAYRFDQMNSMSSMPVAATMSPPGRQARSGACVKFARVSSVWLGVGLAATAGSRLGVAIHHQSSSSSANRRASWSSFGPIDDITAANNTTAQPADRMRWVPTSTRALTETGLIAAKS